MKPQIAAALFFLFASATVPNAARANGVGVFTAVDGEVNILREAQFLVAESGVEVERADIIETGADASAQLDMEDGSILRLGSATRLLVSEYRLDDEKNVVAAGLDLLAGWLRFAVVKLKPNTDYAFQTSTLTIGVRGTEGVIEAANEQSGLHLIEGVVEVGAFGEAAREIAPLRVVGGEYIERPHGKRFTRMRQPPRAFRQRMPRAFERKLVRRAAELKRRGVPPKRIRRLAPDDARKLMQRHPHMHERWRERFGPAVAPETGTGPRSPGLNRDFGPRRGVDPEAAERLKERSGELQRRPAPDRIGKPMPGLNEGVGAQSKPPLPAWRRLRPPAQSPEHRPRPPFPPAKARDQNEGPGAPQKGQEKKKAEGDDAAQEPRKSQPSQPRLQGGPAPQERK